MKKVNPSGYKLLTLVCLVSVLALTTADAQMKKDSLQKFNFQVSPSVSYDLYHFKNTTSNNTITLKGFGGELGLGAFYRLNNRWELGGRLKFDYIHTGATTTTSSSDTTTSSSATSHQDYRFFYLGFDPTVLLRVNDKWIINAGPSVAFNISAKYRNYGTVTETSGGVSNTSNFGSTSYSNLDGVKKNIQFGLNAGVAYQMKNTGVPIQPFIKVNIPINNALDVSEKNHLYGVNVGVNIGIGGGGGTTEEHLPTVEKERCKADTNTHEYKTE
ncbi:MAG TPA: outer membrane beta-barrel protein, partial [Puia sp.]|nr:outer membrane beta-barrel protein [Puia sp.]